MKSQIEVELKFLVPLAARGAVAAEMVRGAASLERPSLAVMYLDTADRLLARQGIAWRLRREGRRWIQALEAGGTKSLERFEHEVVRPDASHDASVHAGTPVGDQLIALLRRAHEVGVEPGVRLRTDVRRTVRTVRTRGARVKIAFDEGRLVAAQSTQRIREIEFELLSGSTTAMLALAERWRNRFGLIYDPRSKAERGDRLAEGSAFPALRKAALPTYADDATPIAALASVLDECLGQITQNAVGLVEGDPALRAEHVHQLRVGIRRLRSALRSFRDWAPSPPADLVAGLRSLFATLGRSRDVDVLGRGVAAELVAAGAPPLTLPAQTAAPDPAEAVRAAETQRTLLGWIAWRASLARPQAPASAGEQAGSDSKRRRRVEPRELHRNIERRLRRWHGRIVADWIAFDELDDARLHALRKRIKRQRYAVEFFAPALHPRQLERYLNVLAAIQDRMGVLNDLFVARAAYQALVVSDSAAWFALGWLAARITEVRALAKSELGQLAKVNPPTT